MTTWYRYALLSIGMVAAISIAVARGKKTVEEQPPAPVEAAPEAAPAAPAAPAPALFPDGLPVALEHAPGGTASLSAQSCNACHYAAHDTWAQSAHATAWSSPSYQAALDAVGDSTACVSCHLPLAAQQPELAAGYVDGDITRPRLQPNPSYSPTLQAEGVTCAACHVRGDTILGTHPSSNAPHPVAVSAELSSPTFCATCHQLTWPGSEQPFYDTFGEWQTSGYAAAGVTCQHCHMAPTAGAPLPGQSGLSPSHASTATLTRALTVLVNLPSPVVPRGQPLAVGLTLQNTGAGHSVPTGNPFKKYDVEVVLLDAANKELAPPQVTTLARTVERTAPYRTTADTRLAVGGVREVTHTFTPSIKGAAGRGALEVRLSDGTSKVVLQRLLIEVQ